MIKVVSTDYLKMSKIAPEDVVEQIMQNVANIISTYKGTVPQDREFGISAELLHKPSTVVKAMLIADIADGLEKYEPRAKLVSLTFEMDKENDSKFNITVEVEINE